VSISLSASGQYQSAVVENGQIYTSVSTLFEPIASTGSTVHKVILGFTGATRECCSTDDVRLTSFSKFGITLTDVGATWTARDSYRNWLSISLSASGQYQSAVVYGGAIYTSDDFGATWTARDSDRDWSSISLSASGQYQSAVVRLGQIYTSTDFGETWSISYYSSSLNPSLHY
jgi:hypothetical protein